MQDFKTLFQKLLSNPGNPEFWKEVEKQSCIVFFIYRKKKIDPFLKLASKLRKKMNEEKLGDFDGYEIRSDLNDGSYYMYGPDAEKIYRVMRPIMVRYDFMSEATVTLNYGSGKNEGRVVEFCMKDDPVF